MTENVQNYYFVVQGMHCVSCLTKVKGLSQSLDGIQDLQIDMSKDLVTVQGLDGFSQSRFVEAVEGLGFRASGVEKQKVIENQKDSRSEVIRLGVTAALAGNLMLLSFATYAGAPDRYNYYFSWISFFLFVPILLYSAFPFYQNSFSSLKAKKASIDVPLAIVMVLGGALSLRNLVLGHSEIYFDSLSVLVFLILSSRMMVKSVQKHYIQPLSVTDLLGDSTISRKRGDQIEEITRSQIKVGDLLQVVSNEVVPADSILRSSSAYFDCSMMTGESDPVEIHQWERVEAGFRCLSGVSEIEVSKLPQDSRVQKMTDQMNSILSRPSRIASLGDRIAQIFTLSVIGIGALFFAIYSQIDLNQAIYRSLALLVIACPCGIAIVTPLALSLAVRKSLKKGLLIKNVDTFEKIAQSNFYIFDKTGTLTSRSSSHFEWQGDLPSMEMQRVIFSLQKRSSHPISGAVIRSLSPESYEEVKLTQYEEKVGFGVEGEFNDKKYWMTGIPGESQKIGLYCDGVLLAQGTFYSELEPETVRVIRELKEKEKDIYILTGDQSEKANRLKELLDLESDHVHSKMTPESKMEFISKKQNVVYIGDGMNDALAMSQSLVSVSMNQSVDTAFRVSDVHLLRTGVTGILDLVEISEKTRKVIVSILAISLLYNIAFGTFALLGKITPLVAAILMPLSSLSLVAICVLQFRKEKL